MAGLLYFFPGLAPADLRGPGNVLNLKRLAQYGLAESLADVRSLERQATLWQITGQGPGAAAGTVLTTLRDGQPPPRVQYLPDVQTWRRCWLDPPLWIGQDNEFPPAPEDLARREQIDGFPVTLAEQSFVVPCIRLPDGRDRLPHDLYFDEEGKFQEVRKSSQEALWARSERTAQFIFGAPGQTMSLEEALADALVYLGVNYRYGPREHCLLRWLDAAACRTILGWAVGEPILLAEREAEKKSASP